MLHRDKDKKLIGLCLVNSWRQILVLFRQFLSQRFLLNKILIFLAFTPVFLSFLPPRNKANHSQHIGVKPDKKRSDGVKLATSNSLFRFNFLDNHDIF